LNKLKKGDLPGSHFLCRTNGFALFKKELWPQWKSNETGQHVARGITDPAFMAFARKQFDDAGENTKKRYALLANSTNKSRKDMNTMIAEQRLEAIRNRKPSCSPSSLWGIRGSATQPVAVEEIIAARTGVR
jgi:hypothetical protein